MWYGIISHMISEHIAFLNSHIYYSLIVFKSCALIPCWWANAWASSSYLSCYHFRMFWPLSWHAWELSRVGLVHWALHCIVLVLCTSLALMLMDPSMPYLCCLHDMSSLGISFQCLYLCHALIYLTLSMCLKIKLCALLASKRMSMHSLLFVPKFWCVLATVLEHLRSVHMWFDHLSIVVHASCVIHFISFDALASKHAMHALFNW